MERASAAPSKIAGAIHTRLPRLDGKIRVVRLHRLPDPA